MNVLHGVWLASGKLCVWAEDSALEATAARRRGRPPRKLAARPHPFACPSDRLREVARVAAATPLVEGLVDRAEAGQLGLLLPSLASGPLASPELVHNPADALTETGADAGGQRVALAPWRVPALRFDARSALELLLHLPAPGAMAPGGTPPGASLRRGRSLQLGSHHRRLFPGEVASVDQDFPVKLLLQLRDLGHHVALQYGRVAPAGMFEGRGHDVLGQYANNRVEADHGRLKARLRPMRGLKQDRNARIVIAGHAFMQNVRRGHYELAVEAPAARRVAVAFDELALAI
jgi:hypothetical protein